LIGVNFFPFRKFIFPSTFLKYFFNKKTWQFKNKEVLLFKIKYL
jgi:hypothetical protein